jgi:hypothetical protein
MSISNSALGKFIYTELALFGNVIGLDLGPFLLRDPHARKTVWAQLERSACISELTNSNQRLFARVLFRGDCAKNTREPLSQRYL